MNTNAQTVTERWQDRLKHEGKEFAEIITYDQYFARVAILSESNDHLIIQFPHVKYPKGRPLVANPCILPGVFEVAFLTQRITKDVDVRVRRYR